MVLRNFIIKFLLAAPTFAVDSLQSAFAQCKCFIECSVPRRDGLKEHLMPSLPKATLQISCTPSGSRTLLTSRALYCHKEEIQLSAARNYINTHDDADSDGDNRTTKHLVMDAPNLGFIREDKSFIINVFSLFSMIHSILTICERILHTVGFESDNESVDAKTVT
jgi:hypothetical protein